MKSDKDELGVAGCLLAVLTLLIQLPLFYAMMFGILQACDAPTWVWVIYWIWVPVGCVLAALQKIIDVIAKSL